jgi:hypothetical protein
MEIMTIDYNESTGTFVLFSGSTEVCTLTRSEAFDRYTIHVGYNTGYRFTDAAESTLDRDLEEMAMYANAD